MKKEVEVIRKSYYQRHDGDDEKRMQQVYLQQQVNGKILMELNY